MAVHYALSALENPALPQADRLVLISPEIGITPVAALAIWQARLGHLLGLAKLEWNSLLPEYDPYKYGSFAVNAGNQAYRLTKAIQSRFDDIGKPEDLDRFPPVLAFASVVDATVSTPALVEGLFKRLPENGHELVLFDLNRSSEIESILSEDPKAGIESMMADTNLAFGIGLVTNESEDSEQVILRRNKPFATEATDENTRFELAQGNFIRYRTLHCLFP